MTVQFWDGSSIDGIKTKKDAIKAAKDGLRQWMNTSDTVAEKEDVFVVIDHTGEETDAIARIV